MRLLLLLLHLICAEAGVKRGYRIAPSQEEPQTPDPSADVVHVHHQFYYEPVPQHSKGAYANQRSQPQQPTVIQHPNYRVDPPLVFHQTWQQPQWYPVGYAKSPPYIPEFHPSASLPEKVGPRLPGHLPHVKYA